MDIYSIIQKISITALPIVTAVVFHEVAHGWVANRLGDPTARKMGRLTLNPIPHMDLIGTVVMPLFLLFATRGMFVFGYAKPVPVNFANLRRPKEDMILVAGAGPATNLVMAAACGFLFRLILTMNPELAFRLRSGFGNSFWSDPAALILLPVLLMLLEAVKWNVVLAVFNMIPIPPLDGGRVMVGLLPDRQSSAWSALEPFGFMIVILLVILDPLGIWSQIFLPLVVKIMIWILGINPFLF